MAKKQVFDQPHVSIGLVGHVDHGKTTLTKALSGKWTDTHSEELKRGITIRLGYANFTVYHKDGQYLPSSQPGFKPIRSVSIVDAPGHESLMATMLAGSMIVDGALLLIAANETCPQPQTREHLQALEIIGIEHVIVVQNKIDLVSTEDALKNYKQIKEFLKGSKFEQAPIVPISAKHNINISYLLEAIEKVVPTPERDPKTDPIMLVARSFDVNKPGSDPSKMVGGILGGSIRSGSLRVGDTVEIRPGRVYEERNQQVYKPFETTIVGLMSDTTKLEQAFPGGSIAVLTTLDPAIVKSDQLTGCVVGKPGRLPPVWQELTMELHLLNRVVGSKEDLKVDPIRMKEPLMLNVNSAATVGIVDSMGKNLLHCLLRLPVCAAVGSRVTISRRIGTRFRLIGYGIITEKKLK